MRPVIGINTDLKDGPPRVAVVQSLYWESVLKAGGVPVLLPPLSDTDLSLVVERIDGVLLIGGRDYCPGLYGQKAVPEVELIDAERGDFDLRLVRKAVRETCLPVLGICGGSQILNIGLGGSLVQDIPSHLPDSKVAHSTRDGWKEGWQRHRVTVLPDTKLAQIYSHRSLDVPTSHHQSVDKLGKGLVVAARAEDGIVEAVEVEERPFVIGVQWHPERDFEGNKQLFVEFVKQAARVRSGRD